MSETGTLEAIAEHWGKALLRLEEMVEPGNLPVLLRELGLDDPPNLLGDAQLTTKLADLVARVVALPPLIDALVLAAEEGDTLPIVEAGAELLLACADIPGLLDSVGTRLGVVLAAVPDGVALAADLATRVFEHVLVRHIETEFPLLDRTLVLLTVVERSVTTIEITGAPVNVVRRRLNLDRVPLLFQNPIGLLEAGYGWGRNDFDSGRLFQALAGLFDVLDPIAYIGDEEGRADPPELDFGPLTFTQAPTNPPGIRGELFVDLGEDARITLAELGERTRAVLSLGGEFSSGLTLDLIPPTRFELSPPAGSLEGRIGFEVIGTGTLSEPLVIFGIAGATRLEAQSIQAGLVANASFNLATGHAEADFGVRAAISGGKIVVSPAGSDGFLSKVLPAEGMELDFDLAIAWSAARGLHVEGGAGLEVSIPVNLSLGPLVLRSVDVEGRVDSGSLQLGAGITAQVEIGPVKAVVQGVGASLAVDLTRQGNLGNADLRVDFKPPNALGLSIDASVVKGGGFLDIDTARGEYAGALELTFAAFSLKALGILTTRRPDGSEGWSLLLMIYGQFTTPIQLSWGFTLSGVGGMIGLHHGCDRPALENGLRSGVLDSILFPRDPVGDAPVIISQLRVVFPLRPDALTIGPMLEIGWGTPNIMKIRLGVLICLDHALGGGALSLSQILILGQLDVQLPPAIEPDLALLKLLVDVLGYVDLDEKVFGFVARLRDSRVALVTLTGMLVVRVTWGERPSFVLAAGGFHPRFSDLPPGLPSPIDRIGAGFSIGPVKITLAGYFAVTPATVQAGARVDAEAKLGAVEVKGYFGFDTIFYFEPTFHFEIDVGCGFAVRYKGHTLAGVDFKGTLTGPGRWHLVGRAEFSILWFTVPIPIDEAWGEPPQEPELLGTDVLALLRGGLENPDSWSAQAPAGGAGLVTVTSAAAADEALAHPLSKLAFTQRRVPLLLSMQRYDRTSILGDKRLEFTEVRIGDTVVTPSYSQEYFARSSFIELSNDDKLGQPSFELFPAGLELGTETYAVPSALAVPLDYETAYLDDEEEGDGPIVRDTVRHGLLFELLAHQLAHGEVARSPLRQKDRLQPATGSRFRVTEAPLALAEATGLTATGVELGALAVHSPTLATQTAPAGALVVEAFEIVAV